MSFLLTLLASALGGAVVAGVFGVYNNRVANKEERDRWVRDHKLQAYSEYLDTTETMARAVNAFRVVGLPVEDLHKTFSEFSTGGLDILAPAAVREAADDVNGFLFQMMNDARNPWVPSPEEFEKFEATMETFRDKRSRVIRLIQQDLELDEVDYQVSGSQLNS
jgi:hypothetical protein